MHTPHFCKAEAMWRAWWTPEICILGPGHVGPLRKWPRLCWAQWWPDRSAGPKSHLLAVGWDLGWAELVWGPRWVSGLEQQSGVLKRTAKSPSQSHWKTGEEQELLFWQGSPTLHAQHCTRREGDSTMLCAATQLCLTAHARGLLSKF